MTTDRAIPNFRFAVVGRMITEMIDSIPNEERKFWIERVLLGT